jgi:hypothetical protein
MKVYFAEYTCDTCSKKSMIRFASPLEVDEKIKSDGWTIYKRRHFCCQECFDKYKEMLIKR